MNLVWIEEPRDLGHVAWLGVVQKGKTDWTPLEKEMINRKGGTSEEDFKAYGTIAGSIGGGAACVATGIGAGVAVGCVILGGILGGIIGGVVGQQWQQLFGKTSPEEYIAQYWNEAIGRGKVAGKGILAVKAYLTTRDYALSRGYSDSWLTKKGYPPAPVLSRWKPSAARYKAAKENMAYCQQAAAKGGIKSDDCSIAKGLGIVDEKFSCADFLYFTFFNGSFGPVSPPSDLIDWYAVGRDETAGNGYRCTDFMTFPTAKQGVFLDTNLSCPTDQEKPTQVASQLIKGLNQLPDTPPPEAAAPPVTKKAGGAPVLILGGLALAGAAAYFLLR